jgi:TetR/AcrR family fatty acid metabolism transcriptional regulator
VRYGRSCQNKKQKRPYYALRIFAEKTFQDSTISEISKESGVSEATIYEYFGTKEDLLFAIPEKITNDTLAESQLILPFMKDVEGRMRAILLSYIKLYQNNPHYSALVLLQLMSNKRFRQTAAHELIRRSAHGLLDCIRDGIADGTFRKDADAYLIRSILMGTIEHLFIHWHMQGMPKREKTIMDMLDTFLELILSGIRTRRDEQGLTLNLKLEDAKALAQLLKLKEILPESVKQKNNGKKKPKNKRKEYNQ